MFDLEISEEFYPGKLEDRENLEFLQFQEDFFEIKKIEIENQIEMHKVYVLLFGFLIGFLAIITFFKGVFSGG